MIIIDNMANLYGIKGFNRIVMQRYEIFLNLKE